MTEKNIKERVIKIIKRELTDMVQKSYKAKMHFRNFSEETLSKKYGLSKETPIEIMEGYEKNIKELKKCISFVENNVTDVSISKKENEQ